TRAAASSVELTVKTKKTALVPEAASGDTCGSAIVGRQSYRPGGTMQRSARSADARARPAHYSARILDEHPLSTARGAARDGHRGRRHGAGRLRPVHAFRARHRTGIVAVGLPSLARCALL